MATEHVFKKISTHTNHGISEATSLDTPPSWGNNIARDIIDNNGPVVAKNKWDRRTGSVVLTKKNEKKKTVPCFQMIWKISNLQICRLLPLDLLPEPPEYVYIYIYICIYIYILCVCVCVRYIPYESL